MTTESSSPTTLLRWVRAFHEGDANQRDLLGGKGAGLAEMTRAGLPVPPGFTVTTEACKAYQRDRTLPEGLLDEVREALNVVELGTSRRFGDETTPLLVSVRSGAKFSMPGMMDTVLNLGLNDRTVAALSKATDNPRFAMDAYRRFIAMFGNVVLEIPMHRFETLLEERKRLRGVREDTGLAAEDLQALTVAFRKLVRDQAGRDFPEDPWEQLRMAVEAVFRSWENPRAVTYRNHHRIAHDLGTAVNVQAMVFGNLGDDSGTGVAFTRNPSTGEHALYGEFLVNAQGEDVVAGIRTPRPIAEMAQVLPEAHRQLTEIATRLEQHFRDAQDLEFTVEHGKLYMLQTRNAKRTAAAAVRMAVEMADEGLISRDEALLRVEPLSLDQLLHPQLDRSQGVTVIARGLPASPGAATGKVVFEADEAERLGKQGERVILVRPETNPDDIHGLIAAQGVLTSRGGMTSHAAVVARGMGKPCVAGCDAVAIDLVHRLFRAGTSEVHEGDLLTLDGATGEVMLGEVPVAPPTLTEHMNRLLDWADATRRLGVRTNADTPEDAARAREFGAQGIGLTRTEHMFMQGDRLPVVQEMILADTPDARKQALARLLPFQKQDFLGIFRAMAGLPVTIRLLDPPLHEFLPDRLALTREVARLECAGGDPERLDEQRRLLARVNQLAEANPMMGLRGCRLGLTYPEINVMQVRAIIEAACELAREGIEVLPEIMIPLVGTEQELVVIRAQLQAVAERTMTEHAIRVPYRFGTMIEVPRAALVADRIAREAEFFSFGTNDLTQLTFGYSRDDAEGKFLRAYVDQGILPRNPFEVLDSDGVGQLVAMAARKGRETRPDLKLGICGEHGGDPESIAFAHEVGLDYVSCSPYRVPIARLAAAQATLR